MTTNPETSDRAGLSEAIHEAIVKYAAPVTSTGRESLQETVWEIERILADRLAVAEQERTAQDWERELSGRAAAEREAATLRAQVAAVEGVYEAVLRRSVRTNGWTPDDWEDFTEGALHDLRAALGDPGPWVDRLKTEGGIEALEQAADALKPRPGKPCERPENCCGTAAQCDAVVPMARVAGEDWLRERARVLRDGGDHG